MPSKLMRKPPGGGCVSWNLVHIAYAAVMAFVEQHAIFQSAHGNFCFALVAVRHVHVQADGAAVGARVTVRHARKIAGNESK